MALRSSTLAVSLVILGVAFVVAALLLRVARIVVQRALDALDIGGKENHEAVRRRARQLTNALTLLAYGVAALAGISLALERFGISQPLWDASQLVSWALTHGVNVLIIVVGAFIVARSANIAIDHLEFKLAKGHVSTDLEWQRRAATLGGILTSLMTAAVIFVAGLMLLRELSIDVMPILTGAGIAGLAIGFGAQNLVRDVISGFFLILEDQVRLGDAARINGIAGTIEQINLRTIVLRDGEGAVQVFPNGTITALANLSKQFAYAIVDLRVAYAENMDRVFGTVREVGDTMQNDPVWGAVLVGPIEVPGVESLADGLATVRVKFKTLPLNQGRVANELRKRLLKAMVVRGIRPFSGN